MSSTVTIWVISPDTRSERRFDLDLTVLELKTKLEHITGIPINNQRIQLYDDQTQATLIGELTEENRTLGFYELRDWLCLKVLDTNPSTSFTGQLTDLSQVEKFELSDEAYAQRQDTVLAYKQRHQVGRFAQTHQQEPPSAPKTEVKIAVGSRCEVESTAEGFHKRGTVRYVGQTKFASGIWVGIEYDEPIGKNDGSVQGEKYFECRPKYGVFVKPSVVKVGDYPVEELELDEEM